MSPAFDFLGFDAAAFDSEAPSAGFAFDDGAFDSVAFHAFAGEAEDATVLVVGQLAALAGEVRVVSVVELRVVGVLPGLFGAVVAGYQSFTDRPLVGHVGQRYQPAFASPSGSIMGYRDASRSGAARVARYQAAQREHAGAGMGYRDAEAIARHATPRYSDALRLPGSAVQDGFQAAVALRQRRDSRFQDAARVPAAASEARFQTAQSHRLARDGRFQDALALAQAGSRFGFSTGHRIVVLQRGRYQDATWIRSGVSEHPAVDPTDPGEPGGETVIVPIQRIYTVINSAVLRRVAGNVLIPNTAMTLTIDVDSWTWGFTARVPGVALPDLEPVGGEPVELEATVNGVAYRAIVEGISRERSFGRSDLTVSGRCRAAVLDAPYSPSQVFGNPTADRTVQQLANDVLSLNGVPLGWDLEAGWQVNDWLVPAGVFSHQGTYMSALNAIAADAGAYVQAHRANKALSVLKRYPAKPWEWGDVTPDFELPAAVVQKEAITWTDKPDFNRVFVRGTKGAGIWNATRAGTAGDVEAPMITAQLATNAIGARQLAVRTLSDTGRQALVSLRMPVLEATGIIPPGKFVRYVDGATTRIGLVRSVSAEIARTERALTIWQTIGVETHV